MYVQFTCLLLKVFLCHNLSIFQNIRNFLDNSTSGVILFSLGCTFDVDKVPKSVTRNLLAAFAQLPFKVNNKLI